MIKYIHVNKFVIQHNNKHGTRLPAYRVQYGKSGKSKYCQEIVIKGSGKFINGFDNPLKCGAKYFLEWNGEVELIGEVPYKTIKDKMKSLTFCKL